MLFIGIDSSLHGYALVHYQCKELNDKHFLSSHKQLGYLFFSKSKEKNSKYKLYQEVYNSIIFLVSKNKSKKIVFSIEDYAKNARSKSLFELGGIGEISRFACYNALPNKTDFTLYEFHPQDLKQVITGSRNATKDCVEKHVKKYFNVEFHNIINRKTKKEKNDDLYDALNVAKLAEHCELLKKGGCYDPTYYKISKKYI